MFSEKTSKLLLWAGIIFILLGIILFFWNDSSFDYHLKINSQKFSDFGSFVGGLIGSIWALAGVILFYVALREQRIDIQINRNTLETQVNALEQQIKEFELQRKELELTREVYIEQSNTLKQQKFENTFFNMSKMLSEIQSNINGELFSGMIKKEYKGHPYLEKALTNLIGKFDRKFEWDKMHGNDLMELTANIYNKFADENLSPLDHYFRYFYNILKFIDNSQMEDKKMYADLLQAQLSKNELGLIFYNGIGKIGKAKLYILLEKYNFLENLNPDSIYLQNNVQTKLYPFTTFKFLSPSKKGEIIINAIIMNPDKVKNDISKLYYFNKYNVSNEVVRAIYKNYESGELKLYQKNVDKRIIEHLLEELLNQT